MIVCAVISLLFFFFSSRRRHTRFSRDWSSDVCSSDLTMLTAERHAPASSPTLSRRRIALAIVGLALIGAGAAAGASAMAAEESANGNLCIEHASLAELQQALADGRPTDTELARAFIARIGAYGRD